MPQPRNDSRPCCALRIVLALAFALSALSGCVTGSAGDGGEVIERSKEQTPAWCSLDAGRLHEEGTTVRYVQKQAGLMDLPLGVKQTQLAGLSSSRLAVAAEVRSRLVDAADSAGVQLAAANAELDRHVMAATEEFHGRAAKVADIYFEKRRSNAGETYGVLILIQMPRAGLDELVRNVGQRLSQSTDTTLRRLGQILTKSPAAASTGAGLSH